MTAQSILLRKYGDPKPSGKYLSKYCSVWKIKKDFSWFPISEFEVNNDFKKLLFTAFTELQKQKLHTEIKKFDGCYNYRKSRTTELLSLHSWAAAIDLNATIEKLGNKTTKWSKAFIKVMVDAGLFWGGNFKHIRDNMHFALLDG